MLTYVWIALGSALGGISRHALSSFLARVAGETFPWGTLAVNVSGSLVIGALASLIAADGRPLLASDARALLMVGMCGGYTTFSTFSLESLNLARSGEWMFAATNVLLSVLLCLLGVWLGYIGGSVLNR